MVLSLRISVTYKQHLMFSVWLLNVLFFIAQEGFSDLSYCTLALQGTARESWDYRNIGHDPGLCGDYD